MLTIKTQTVIFGSVICLGALLGMLLVGLISNAIENRKREKAYLKALERKCKLQEKALLFYRNNSEVNNRG